MSTNVTNVEGLRFSVYDEATPNLDKLQGKLQGVQHATEGAIAKVKGWGKQMALGALGAVGLGFGISRIAEAAKAANLELEDASNKVAGATFAFSHWQKGTSAIDKWRTSMESAAEVVERLDEVEGRVKIGRGELGEIYATATQMGARHNLTQEQMIELTEKLGATQKVLGTNAQFAAMMITRAAQSGTIIGRDKFGMMLKGAIGDMKAFRKLSEPQRFEALKKAMGDLVPAAMEMGKVGRGAMFDIRQSVEQILRDFTKPIFGAATKSLREIAKHVTELQASGKSVAQVWGERLLKAYHALETASKFIAAHWREIALIWGSSKVAGIVGALSKGGIGGLFGRGAAAAGGEIPAAAGGVATSFASVASKANLVVGGLVALKIAADGAAEFFLNRQAQAIREQAAGPRAMTALVAGAKAYSAAMHEEAVDKTFGHLKSAFEAYGLKPGQVISKDTLAAELRAMEPGLAAKQVAMFGIRASAKGVQAPGVLEDAAGKISSILTGLASDLLKAYPELGKKKLPLTPGGPPVNNFNGDIHITQEFKEADPDRVFHKVVRDINDAAMNRRDSAFAATASSPGAAR